jgi:hypothetical protein
MKRRVLLPFVAAVGLLAALTMPAVAVPEHLHCLNLANGNVVPIGFGVTTQAPHDSAFHNFHSHVHTGVPGTGPLTITVDFTAPYSCPPSP